MQKSIVLGILYLAVLLVTTGMMVYIFILFVKLARRGITALDIYINNNKK